MANPGVVLRSVMHELLLIFPTHTMEMLLVLPLVQLFTVWGIRWSATSLCACGETRKNRYFEDF